MYSCNCNCIIVQLYIASVRCNKTGYSDFTNGSVYIAKCVQVSSNNGYKLCNVVRYGLSLDSNPSDMIGLTLGLYF